MALVKTLRNKKLLIFCCLVLVLAIVSLAFWYLPIYRFTYSSNGKKILSFRYPLKDKNTIDVNSNEYGGLLDIGSSPNSIYTGGTSLIHILYMNNKSTFTTNLNANPLEELSYSMIKNCDDFEKYYLDRSNDGYQKGYTTKNYDGRTMCLLDWDAKMQPDVVLGEIVLNPKPEGVMSVLYAKEDSRKAESILNSLRFYK